MEPERRSMGRYPLRLPIYLLNPGLPEASGITRDVSSEGVFFYLASEFAQLSDIELRLILPPELTNSVALHLQCTARVVRVEGGPDGTVGLAAAFESSKLTPFATERSMAPTVSVVIPTFNRSAVITNAIESVLAQTYMDYELIVVDDGSTDDTWDRLQPYSKHIRYFRQNNRGASAALNKGIELATGQWVSILASDDVWLPTKLEKQISAVKALGGTVGACFTDCTHIGNPSSTLSAFQQAGLESQLEFGVLDDPIKSIMGRYTPIWVQSLLVLRSLLQDINGFDETMTTQEDTDLLFRLAFKTKFCFVATPLVKIDSTPSRPRLRDLNAGRNDPVYARLEYRYKKWLGLQELGDSRTREAIRDQLCVVYYSWAIACFYRLQFSSAIAKISETRRLGESYPKICLTFLLRAFQKVFCSLTGQ